MQISLSPVFPNRVTNSSFLVSWFFCVCTCFLISCKSIGNLYRISWRPHSLKKWVQIMMISPVYILCIICNYPPKGRRLVVDIQLFRERLSDKVHAATPERYCGLFWVHCFSKKFERMVGEAVDICLRVLKVGNKSRFDSYSVRNSVLIISHITFRDCRVHIFSDNLSRNSCILRREASKYISSVMN